MSQCAEAFSLRCPRLELGQYARAKEVDGSERGTAAATALGGG